MMLYIYTVYGGTHTHDAIHIYCIWGHTHMMLYIYTVYGGTHTHDALYSIHIYCIKYKWAHTHMMLYIYTVYMYIYVD